MIEKYKRLNCFKIRVLAKYCLIFVLGIFFAETVFAEVVTQLRQGGIFIGKVAEEEKVIYQGESVATTSHGMFVIGFGRDAPLKQNYEIHSDAAKRVVDLNLTSRQYQIQYITGIAKKHMSLNEETLKRVTAENLQISQARQTFSKQSHFLQQGFIWPLKGKITGVYGSQRVFNDEPRRPHYGLDIAAPIGTKVKAPADGKVVLFHPDMFFSGGTMIIDHGLGVSTTFIHLNKALVKESEIVTQGQLIAEVGNTGRTTGAHLDWRINWFDVRLDPLLLVAPENKDKRRKNN